MPRRNGKHPGVRFVQRTRGDGGVTRYARWRESRPRSTLRQTCGTFLTNAPGIYAGASAFKSARRLGHSVAVAERFYLGRARVSIDARTLEDAMQITELLTARGLHPINPRQGDEMS